jgi:hypothetical protein
VGQRRERVCSEQVCNGNISYKNVNKSDSSFYFLQFLPYLYFIVVFEGAHHLLYL